MEEVVFMSVAYLKENTTIDKNVDDSKLLSFIVRAQDIYIQQALGTNYYNLLRDKVSNNTLTPAEVTLISDYIIKTLCEFAYYLAYFQLNVKTTNAGNVEQHGENSQNADYKFQALIRGGIKDMGEFYLQRLITFLQQNPTTYPEYYNVQGLENLPKSNKAYDSGIWLGRNNDDDDCYDQYSQYKNR